MTTTAIPPDPNDLQRRASDPARTVWVGASAGSGKTKVLTDRVLRLLLAGSPPERLLCLTFTRAAAAEMANRINKTLATWATATERELAVALEALAGTPPDEEMARAARRLFARVVDCPGSMKIETIHAFCQSLLRRFPLEAGLAPHFEVMDDRTATTRLSEARDAVLHAARMAPETPLGLAVARLTGDLAVDTFTDVMRALTAERGQLARSLEDAGGGQRAIGLVRRALGLSAGETEASIVADACRDDAFDETALRLACQALATGSKTDIARGLALQSWLDRPEARIDGFSVYLRALLTADFIPQARLITKKPAAAFPSAAEALEREAVRLSGVHERITDAATAEATASLLTFAEALLARYDAAKRETALLDFDDLIQITLQLLSDDRVPWVLYKLDGGLDHILIDEAQDTNPDQWRVIQALADSFFAGADAARETGVIRTLFVVGDEKQSIFSFQRADPAEFTRMRRHFQEKATAAKAHWAPVDLDISFRSTAAVLRAVDAVFAAPAVRDGVVGADAPAIRHRPFRAGHAGTVELWPLVTPQPAAEEEAWTPPVNRTATDAPSTRLATVIAATIRKWVDDGEPLPARGRPVRPGDILILVRRRNQFVTHLVRALKDRQVPVAGVDRMVLGEQLAVRDLLALASFLLLPEDDLTLATVLKGPLIGLTDEALFPLAWRRRGSLWRSLVDQADHDPGLRPARTYLEGLLAESDFAPPYEFFAGVLASPCPTDPISGRRAILGRLGPDAQDPLDEFLAATLAFERTDPPSLQLFLAWLAASDAQIKREMEQGANVVRIMTVHGSKGLQAPIVFLPDTTSVPQDKRRILWPDSLGPSVALFAGRNAREAKLARDRRARARERDEQELRRLLYVALTRAEDRLIVCGAQGARPIPATSWYRLVEAAFTTFANKEIFDFTTLTPKGWQAEGYRFADRQTVPAKTDGHVAHVEDDTPATPPAWVLAPPEREPQPPRPLVPSHPDEDEPAVRSPIDPAEERTRFLRGTLIHRLLQTLPEMPAAQRPAACHRLLSAPVHRLSVEAVDRITTETLAVIDDPAIAPLFAPGSRAEVPVTGLVGTRAVSGRVDRLAITETEIWIADFKTNRPPPRLVEDVPPVYLQQMAAYRDVLALIFPHHRPRPVLVWTDGPFAMELGDVLPAPTKHQPPTP